jgi:hypothetical protein
MKASKTKNESLTGKAGNSFFTKNGKDTFFTGNLVQRKLSVNQPNDKYEKEADAMADKVVQKMTEPALESRNNKDSTTPFFVKGISSIQRKCTECEKEDKLQKKGEEADELQNVQRKPIFESDAEDAVQRKTNEGASVSTSHSLESKLNTSKGSGLPLSASTNESMSKSFGTDFSHVRIHSDSEATEMNKELNAQAFTNGNDIYFNQGKYNPETKSGQQLLAHELTHVVQQGREGTIRRNAERDAAGNYTGNYIFNPGHDNLNRSFFSIIKRNVADGTLDDAEIAALRTNAVARNGTIMHAELLLMAAMRNPVNVALMQAHRSGPLVISMINITQADRDYITNFGRESLPLDVIVLNLRLMAAMLGLSTERVEDVEQELSLAAEQQIMQHAGAQFADQASKLVVSAEFSDPKVPLTEILVAMLNAASDSTAGDKVMAGSIYDVAKKANHPMAERILSGALKVDAMIPSVYRRVAGSGDASYTYSTDENVRKSDTLYVPTSLDIFQLDDRALIIHELTHAADDFAVTGRQQVDSLTLETHAYKEQGKYMMDQILAQPPGRATGFINTASQYTNQGPLFYWLMVAAAKDDTTRYEQVLVDINTAAPMSMTTAAIRADLGLTTVVLDTRVRTELVAYRDRRGNQLYTAGTTTVDGAAGHYFQ